MNENKMPLSLMMESARGKLFSAFNQILDECRLPAYLIEGMILEILSEVRSRKNAELALDISKIQSDERPSMTQGNDD